MKHRILWVSKYGDGADLALRMALEEGVEVRLWIEDPKYRVNFSGVLDKVASFQEGEKWASFVVYDDNKCTHLKTTKPKFGGSDFGARLENDRAFTQSLCKRAGLNVGEHKSFRTGAQVLTHLRENKDKTWVIKPEGGKSESHHLIIGSEGHDGETMAQVERLVESGLIVASWEVEEKKKGLEAAVTRYFNGQDWLGPAAVNFEHKHIATGNIGGLCGEAGTLVKHLETEEFFDKTLGRLTPALRAADYRGVIDMNCIVAEDGTPWLIELTPRPGKPISFILEELRITPLSKIFWACATGGHLDIQVRYDWAVGVVLFAFGFPFEKVAAEISQGLPISGLPKSLEHIHLMQVRRDGEKGAWKVGYGEGYLLVATGRGEMICDAKWRAYDEMYPIRVPNAQHRLDISDKINERELRELGILPEREFVAEDVGAMPAVA